MEYSVKQLADLAGVSVRTFHYYDEIGLLNPSHIGINGYRYYQGPELFRLQQILLYRELDFDLKQIGLMLERPDFDPIQALQEHREALGKRIERINLLVETVDNTIARLERERDMDEGKMFTGFSEEDLERYKQEAIQRWGDEEVQSSYKLWDSYSEEQKQKIKAEGNAIYNDLVECLPEGPASAEAQSLIGRWHQNLRCFYKPSIGRMRGLGEMYVSDPKFSARFRELHPNLPEFLRSAIRIYCDDLDRT